MPLDKPLSQILNSAALGIAMSGNVYAQGVETPPTDTKNNVTVNTADTTKLGDCTLSERTTLGALFGSASKGLGNLIGNKLGIDGLGRTAGTIAQESISPDCVKEPTARRDRHNVLGK